MRKWLPLVGLALIALAGVFLFLLQREKQSEEEAMANDDYQYLGNGYYRYGDYGEVQYSEQIMRTHDGAEEAARHFELDTATYYDVTVHLLLRSDSTTCDTIPNYRERYVARLQDDNYNPNTGLPETYYLRPSGAWDWNSVSVNLPLLADSALWGTAYLFDLCLWNGPDLSRGGRVEADGALHFEVTEGYSVFFREFLRHGENTARFRALEPGEKLPWTPQEIGNFIAHSLDGFYNEGGYTREMVNGIRFGFRFDLRPIPQSVIDKERAELREFFGEK